MSEQVFIRLRGRIQGPFAPDQLQGLARRGQFSRTHEISTDGVTWSRATTRPDLFPEVQVETAGTSSPPESPQATNAPTGQPRTASHQQNWSPTSPPTQPPVGHGVSQVWYYSKDGREQTATDLDQLRRLVSVGQIEQDTLVWTEGMSDWIAVRQVPQLTNSQAILPSASSGATEEVSRAALDALARTRPWVIFVSIFGFVIVGLMALSGISALATGTVVNSAHLVLQAGASFVVMLVYCAISYLLLRYGIQIGRLQLVPTHQKLHDALRAQHHFWRATGLALLIAILVGIVLFAVLVYLGAIAFDSLRLTHDRVT